MSSTDSEQLGDEEALELPAMEEDVEDDELVGAYDGQLELPLVRETEDESTALLDDAAVEIDFITSGDASSIIGDDAEGLEDDPVTAGLLVNSDGASWVEPQEPEFGLEEDTSLGIAPAPREVDDGGEEGVFDPTAHDIDATTFPPLDDDESESTEELDLVLELPAQQSSKQ